MDDLATNPKRTTLPQNVGDILYYAHVFDPKRWKASVSQTPNPKQILKTVEALFDDLDNRGFSYLLVGGIAMLAYVEGRNTKTIDLILGRNDLNALPGLEISEESQYFAPATYQGLQGDLLLTQNPLFEQVQQSFKTGVSWGNHAIPCATPEGLVILKLYALPSLFRQGRFDRAALYETDILQLTASYNLDLDAALQVVDPYAIVSDRTELRQIARDIEQRLNRMHRAQRHAISEKNQEP